MTIINLHDMRSLKNRYWTVNNWCKTRVLEPFW